MGVKDGHGNMAAPPVPELIALLRAACACLDAAKFEAAVQLLRSPPEQHDAARASLMAIATALIAERDGDADAAGRGFEAALAEGTPLPAALRQCGRYFKRTGQYQKAFHCYALLRDIVPGIIEEFADGLPEAELARYAPAIVPALLARLRLYALAPIKRALAGRLGVAGAALAFAGLTARQSPAALALLPVCGLQEQARARGLVHEELAPPIDLDLPPPRVFGGAAPEGLRTRTRAFFVCALQDAVVSGKSNLLLCGDRALLDVQPGEREKLDLDLEVDFITIAATREAVQVLVDADPQQTRHLDRAFSLVGIHSHSFGHWIAEFLPKLWACRERPGFASLPLLVDDRMPPQHLEALRCFIGDGQELIVLKPGEAVRVRQLWVCSTLYYVPVGPRGVPPWRELFCLHPAFAGLVAGLRPQLAAIERPEGPRRLYLTRKASQHRRLVNSAEIEAWAAAHGFAIVDFADIPFVEQLRLVRGADLIIGPDGSAMLMAFFARPQTRIGALSHPFIDQLVTYTHVFGDLGCHYAVLTGELVGENRDRFSDYRIGIGRLHEFVDALSLRKEAKA